MRALTRILIILNSILILLSTFSGVFENNLSRGTTQSSSPDTGSGSSTLVIMEIKNFGIVEIELYDTKVPDTVDNFVHYVDTGFYDGLIFHRIINSEGGMQIIQGGGFYPGTKWNQKVPTNNSIKLEIDSSLTHVEGAVAMARTSDPDSATSQFYICVGENNHFLDGNYAVFGKVTSGMNVVRSINKLEVDEDDWPLEDVIIETAYAIPPKKISISSHSTNEVVTGEVMISGTLGEIVVNPLQVEIKVDNGPWNIASGTSSWSYMWDSTETDDGMHNIYVRVLDGQTYSDPEEFSLFVQNNPEASSGVKEESRSAIWIFGSILYLAIISIIVVAVLCVIIVIIITRNKKQPPAHQTYPSRGVQQSAPNYQNNRGQQYPPQPPQPPPY